MAKAIDECDKNHKENDSELVSGHMPQMQSRRYCPVNSFHTYLSLLSDDEDALWQTPRFFNYYDNDENHYGPGRVGHNTLDNFVKKLCKMEDKNYTNHSLRSTGVTMLKRANYSDKQNMSITGHKSHSNLDIYSHIDRNEKLKMGYALGYALMFPSSVPMVDMTNAEIAPKEATMSINPPKRKPMSTVSKATEHQ